MGRLKINNPKTFIETDVVKEISRRTKIPKGIVRICLNVFRVAFKNQIKNSDKRPITISGVLKIYKRQNKNRTLKDMESWRLTDKEAPYKENKNI